MTRRALVVCTANVCRSPTAERLLRRRLDRMVDTDGVQWAVSSAGVADLRVALDDQTVAAARALGVDLGDHVARHLDRQILLTDGADLVLVMTRAHLRAVIGIDPAWWPRTFMLKELVRRAATSPLPAPDEGVPAWLSRLAEGRRAAAMMTPDPSDDEIVPGSVEVRW